MTLLAGSQVSDRYPSGYFLRFTDEDILSEIEQYDPLSVFGMFSLLSKDLTELNWM